jgi:ABC-type hemin transport system substrate-binding protein
MWPVGWFDSRLGEIYHPRGMGQPRGATAGVIFTSFAVALAAMLCSGCREKASAPATGPTTRGAGTAASLSPAATDLILGMGAGDHLVAVSNYDPADVGKRKLPRVGDYLTTDWETLATLRPATMIIQMDPVRLPEGFTRRAQRLGIKLLNVRINRLDDVMQASEQIGGEIGEPAKGKKLADELRERIEAVRRRCAGQPRVRTLLTLDDRGESIVGRGEFLDDMLTAAGGENAGASLAGAYPRGDIETLIALKPDAVIILKPGATAELLAKAKELCRRLEVPAGRDGRVYLIADENVLLPGSHVAQVTEEIARLLHPRVE